MAKRFAHSTLAPLGEHVTAELADKLEAPGARPRLLMACSPRDITGRARAFNSAWCKAGMDVERAAALSGLLAEGTTE